MRISKKIRHRHTRFSMEIAFRSVTDDDEVSSSEIMGAVLFGDGKPSSARKTAERERKSFSNFRPDESE